MHKIDATLVTLQCYRTFRVTASREELFLYKSESSHRLWVACTSDDVKSGLSNPV